MVSPRIHVLFCALLFVLHVATQQVMRYPTIFYDEFLYLGLGRFFAGMGPMPNLYAGVWGHLGYSGVLIPAYWLFREFPNQYHAVLFINAILMTCTYPLLYLVLKRLASEPSRWLAPISFTASVYPSFLLFSKFAISENLFTPLFLLALLLWARFLEKPTKGRAVSAGLGVLACYLVHNRGLSVSVCLIVFGLLLGYLKRIPWKSAMVVAGIGVFNIILIGELKHLLEITWPQTMFPAADLSAMTSPQGPGLFGLVMLGQLVYLVSSTFGLFLYGIGYFVLGCSVNRAANAGRVDSAVPLERLLVRRDLIVFLLAVQVCVYIGSAAYVSTLEILNRADHVLMGRYNEPLLPVFIASGLLLLVEAGTLVRPRRMLVACAALCAAVSVAGTFVLAPAVNWQWLNGPIPRVNIFSFMPIYRALQVDNLGAILALSCAVAVLAALGGSWRWPAPVIYAIASIFVIEACFYTSKDISMLQSLAAHDASGGSTTRIVPLLAASRIEGPVDVDTAAWNPVYFSLWQLFSGERQFRTFHGPAGMKAAGPLVIAEKDWRGARAGYRDVGCENDNSACLWIKQPPSR